MRALTLTQPWAGLVAAGIKLVENRSRPMIKKEDFGKPFALHASRFVNTSVINRAIELDPNLAPRGPYGLADARWYKLGHIRSSVLAVATIRDAMHIGGNSTETTLRMLERLGIPEQLPWTFGPTVYVLAGPPLVLPEPVPCRGRQGFWTLPADVAARVEAQL